MYQQGGDLYTVRRKTKNTIRDITRIVKGEPLSLKRRVNVYPPQVRDLLARVGTEAVTSMTVTRAPIQSFVRTLMNVISLGTYEQAVRSANYDQMFHLALHINGKYLLDKQAVVKLQVTSPQANAEKMPVGLSKSVTIQELVDNTRATMGPQQFSNYNAQSNNCQVFIRYILQANGLLTPELSAFIMQDAVAVFRRMPSFTQKLSSMITDIGSVADRLIEGEGKSRQKNIQEKMPVKKESPWLRHVKDTMAKNPGKNLKDVLKMASASYKK